jgi:hypothetical protein
MPFRLFQKDYTIFQQTFWPHLFIVKDIKIPNKKEWQKKCLDLVVLYISQLIRGKQQYFHINIWSKFSILRQYCFWLIKEIASD